LFPITFDDAKLAQKITVCKKAQNGDILTKK